MLVSGWVVGERKGGRGPQLTVVRRPGLWAAGGRCDQPRGVGHGGLALAGKTYSRDSGRRGKGGHTALLSMAASGEGAGGGAGW